MYGVGQLTLGIILNEARCRVTFIHERHNPLFGGRSPAPDLEALRMLRDDRARGALRPGAGHRRRRRPHRADRRARQLHPHQRPAAAALLVSARGARGSAAAWCATWRPPTCSTGWRPRLARSASRRRWASSGSPRAWSHNDALLGGESSGGLTIRGHILGKDGIFASALIVEMLAVTGKHISELQEIVLGITGPALHGGRQPARHRRHAHHRPAARQGDDRRRGGALSGASRSPTTTAPRSTSSTTTGRCCASPAPSRCCASSPRPTRPKRRASWWIG